MKVDIPTVGRGFWASLLLIVVPAAFAWGTPVIEETPEELRRALQKAATDGSIGNVEGLLGQGVDPNAPVFSEGGERLDGPLAVAVLRGHIPVVERLVAAGADPDGDRGKVVTYLWTTPTRSALGRDSKVILGKVWFERRKIDRHMRKAAEEGDLEAVRRYLERGERSMYSKDREEMLAALERGDAAMVRALIEPPVIEDTSQRAIAEPLRLALDRRDRQLLGRLIEGGAPFNGLDRDGFTPLVVAARMGWLEAAQDLVAAGADVDLVDQRHSRPLSMATGHGQTAMVEYLLEAGAPVSRQGVVESRNPVITAASAGQRKLMHFLIAHPTMSDPTGRVVIEALRAAISAGHGRIVDDLIPLGRDEISLAGLCDGEMFRKLVVAGVSVDRPDDRGRNPLVASLRCYDREKTFRLLLKLGADPNERMGPDVVQQEGVTALMTVAGDDRLELMELLFEAGADPDIASDRGVTTLMKLCNSRNIDESIAAMLAAGADPDLRDPIGRTALIWAANSGNASAITRLLAAGADESLRDDEGRTAWEHFWWRMLEERGTWTIASPAGDLQLALPREFGQHVRQPLEDGKARGANHRVTSFEVTRLGERVEIDPFDPIVVTEEPSPEITHQPWLGLEVPVVRLAGQDADDLSSLVAVVPWGEDTLVLRVSDRERYLGRQRWLMRGVLNSLKPLHPAPIQVVNDPGATWQAVLADGFSRRRIPVPARFAVSLLLIALITSRIARAWPRKPVATDHVDSQQ